MMGPGTGPIRSWTDEEQARKAVASCRWQALEVRGDCLKSSITVSGRSPPMPPRTSKPKPTERRRSANPKTHLAQSARSLETAKKLEVHESGEAFERALAILPVHRKKKP